MSLEPYWIPFRATDQAISPPYKVEDSWKARKAAQLPEDDQVIKEKSSMVITPQGSSLHH